MPFVIADRVRETSATTGTGSITLDGAVTGYQTFDAVLDTADTTYYTIAEQNGPNWEVGIGTFTAPATLARTTILSSSSGGSIVTFNTGAKDVFISLPASRTVQSFSGGSTGLTPSTASFGPVTLGGTLAIANGGTGATTGAAALSNLGGLPLTGGTLTGPTVVSVNSSSDALRITQTGTGNALVVEDSANPDATPFVINADGRLVAGHTSSILLQASTYLGEFLSSGVNYPLAAGYTGNSAVGPRFALAKNRSADWSTQTIVASGDTLGDVEFQGSDGTNTIVGARITAAVDGTPGTNDMPGRLVFSTTADGASSPTERMRITNAGRVGIGTTAPGAQLALSHNRAAGGFAQTWSTTNGATFENDTTLRFDGAAAFFGNFQNFPLAFLTNNTERVRIDASGNVGIGTSSPTQRLDVSGIVRATAYAGIDGGTF